MAQLKFFIPTLLLAGMTNSVMAGEADYQFDADYAVGQHKYDNSIDEKDTLQLAGFDYYLEPVKITDQPLAEAAFMNRISSIGIALGKFDADANNQTGDGNLSAIQYTYMQPGSALWLQVAYYRESADYKFKPGYAFVDYSYDRTQPSISIGGFIAQNTAVAFEYSKDKYTFSPAVYSSSDFTVTRSDVTAKHLMPTGNGTMVNIEGTIGINNYDNKDSADTKNTVFTITGDYYLNNMYSVGGSFEKITGDDNGYKGQTVAVRGQFFLTSKFSLAAEISRFSGEGTSDDDNYTLLDATLRF